MADEARAVAAEQAREPGRSAWQAPQAQPDLVLAWGNPSRGDDALGPALLAQLRRRLQAGTPGRTPAVELVEDFQLQVEHALDLDGRRRVLFVDASRTAAAPFEVGRVQPGARPPAFSHALSPQALLGVWAALNPGAVPPACTVLAIRGERFGLGQAMSDEAQAHARAALAWVLERWLGDDVPAEPGSAT